MYDKDDNLVQRFTCASGRMPISMTQGSSKYYLHYDQVGSLRAVSDTNHNIIKEIIYDSFGNILSDSNESFSVPFGFAGGLLDRDTGLIRFGYRDYDSYTGKWTAKDPIDFSGGDTNLYGYVLNDPVNFVDVYGLKIFVCNRKVNGFPFTGNHSYVWDSITETAKGMRGSSGSGANSNEKGPSSDQCNAVDNSEGKESEIMNFMRENQNNGMWFPYINDCHNAVDDAIKNSGLITPGAPGGRTGVIK